MGSSKIQVQNGGGYGLPNDFTPVTNLPRIDIFESNDMRVLVRLFNFDYPNAQAFGYSAGAGKKGK